MFLTDCFDGFDCIDIFDCFDRFDCFDCCDHFDWFDHFEQFDLGSGHVGDLTLKANLSPNWGKTHCHGNDRAYADVDCSKAVLYCTPLSLLTYLSHSLAKGCCAADAGADGCPFCSLD